MPLFKCDICMKEEAWDVTTPCFLFVEGEAFEPDNCPYEDMQKKNNWECYKKCKWKEI